MLVRIRPLQPHELADDRQSRAIVRAKSASELAIEGDEPRHRVTCRFDAVLGSDAVQADVYEHIRECTSRAVRGYNATVFAYGQTGSGKTHTMFGPPGYHSNPAGAD